MQKTDVNTALAIFFIATAVMLIAGLVVTVNNTQQTAFADGGGETKVTQCHIPPGNPANQHDTTTGAPSTEKHTFNHGDRPGPCPPDI